MSGPSARALAGHHLIEAIKHLHAAASFVRETPHEDAEELACILECGADTARDIRSQVEEKVP